MGVGKRLDSNSRTLSTSMDSLPEELLFHILLLLPADFLHDVARLVCRKWYKTVRSRAFVNMHTDHHCTYGLLLRSRYHDHPVYVTATRGRIEVSELSHECRTRIVATCNGLAVESHHDDVEETLSLRVINPATKQLFLLPSVSTRDKVFDLNCCGIAYSAATMEYKVTLAYSSVGQLRLLKSLDVFTLGVDTSWRNVPIPYLDIYARMCLGEPPLSTEGFLHWSPGRHVLTMDVETELFTFSQVLIPPHSSVYQNRFFHWSTRSHLSMLVSRGEYSWDIWEMKRESGEWRKLEHKIIELGPQKCKLPHQEFVSGYDNYLRPLGWVKYLEVLAFRCWCEGRDCFFYNLDTHEIKTVELPDLPGRNYRGLAHRNSLVWLS